jgi:hypothetical protein
VRGGRSRLLRRLAKLIWVASPGFAALTSGYTPLPALPAGIRLLFSTVAIQQVVGRPEFELEVEVRSKPSRDDRGHVASPDR